MRCEAAQLTLSARMDGAATASEAASAVSCIPMFVAGRLNVRGKTLRAR